MHGRPTANGLYIQKTVIIVSSKSISILSDKKNHTRLPKTGTMHLMELSVPMESICSLFHHAILILISAILRLTISYSDMSNIYFVSLTKDVPSLFKPKSDEVELTKTEVKTEETDKKKETKTPVKII